MHTIAPQLLSDSYFAHGYTVFLLMGIFSAIYVGLSIVFQHRNIESILHVQRKLLGVAVIVGAVVALSFLLHSGIEAQLLVMMKGVVSADIQLAVVKWLLVTINACCLVVGMMLCFHEDVLARAESLVPEWLRVRRHLAMESVQGN